MTEMRERRTLAVVVLDAALTFFVAMQAGRLPFGRAVPRRTAVWTAVGGVVAVAGTAALLVMFLRSPDGLAPLGVGSPPPAAIEPPPPGRTAPATPAPTTAAGPTATAPPATGGPDRSRPASTGTTTAGPTGASTTGPAPRPPVPLTGTYAATEGGQGLLGYRASVTVANPGAVAKNGWVLVIVLPRPTLTVAEVTGATARRDGSTWTFTPDAGTATVAAGGSVRVEFEVRGATLIAARPTSCTVDGARCAGL